MNIYIANKAYSAGHPIVEVLAELKIINSLLVCLPEKWGDFSPYEYATQLITYIDTAINSPTPKKYFIFIQEIMESMSLQIPFIAPGPDYTYILSRDSNKDFLQLHGHAFKLYNLIVKARDQLDLEHRELSVNLISVLELIASKMEVFISWLWQFVKMYSSNDDGKLMTKAKIVLWNEEKIKELNL